MGVIFVGLYSEVLYISSFWFLCVDFFVAWIFRLFCVVVDPSVGEVVLAS